MEQFTTFFTSVKLDQLHNCISPTPLSGKARNSPTSEIIICMSCKRINIIRQRLNPLEDCARKRDEEKRMERRIPCLISQIIRQHKILRKCIGELWVKLEYFEKCIPLNPVKITVCQCDHIYSWLTHCGLMAYIISEDVTLTYNKKRWPVPCSLIHCQQTFETEDSIARKWNIYDATELLKSAHLFTISRLSPTQM